MKKKSPEGQTLIILRHAHRNTTKGSHLDNGLSEKGWEQAKRIKRHFQACFEDVTPSILSSPKLRCLETVEKLGKFTGVEVQPSELLNEGGDLFSKTLRLTQEIARMDDPVLVLCSHGDVIPILLHRLIGTEILLDKGGWIQLEKVGGRFHLQWVLQEIPAN